MKPYYDDGKGIVIYHGDARDFVGKVACDAIVTDPPYGLGDRWQGGTWGANPMYADARKWDVAPEAELIAKISAGAETVVIWGGNYFALPPSRCWLAWVKAPAMQTMADMELAWTNLDRPAKLTTETRNPDGQRQHPTQKPLSVMRWTLSQIPDAQTILDPFMGSGTTLVAAKQLGRKCIGIELEERYCEIAVMRLAQDVLDFGEKEGVM